VADNEAIRQKRMAALNRLKKKPSLHIDEETGAIFGSVSAQLKKAGRSSDFRIQDVWIASQAIQHGYRLLTRNQKDFQDIPGLDCIIIKEAKKA
jgi:predicted nucleic acid-binding protein